MVGPLYRNKIMGSMEKEEEKKEEIQSKKICPNCKSVYNDKNVQFCAKCGAILQYYHKRCSKCGKIVEEGTKFCPNCGNKLAGKTSNKQKTLMLYLFLGIAICLIYIGDKYNLIEFGNTKESKHIEYLSDKIVLNPDSVCLNMNPFTYKHKLQLVKVSGKKELDIEGVEDKTNTMGCVIKLVLSFKNISDSTTDTESFKIKYKIKDVETGEILFSGDENMELEPIKPNEIWAKSFEVLQCTFLYSGKINVLLTIDDIEVEELEINPSI